MSPRRPAARRDRPAGAAARGGRRRERRHAARRRAGRPRTSPRGSRSWAAAARFVGKRADDEAGGVAAGELERRGVELRGPGRRRPDRHGRLARRAGRRAARWPPTAASRRSCAPTSSIPPGWRAASTCISPATRSCARPSTRPRWRAAALAPRVSVDLSSWSAIRDFGPERFRERLEALQPAVVFANEDEERIIGGRLAGLPRGCSSAGRSAPASTASSCRRCPRTVVDSTGAGDALAAGYLVGGPELALGRGGALRGEARVDAVNDVLRVSDEVGHALADRRAVVALETTLVAHGFPPGEGVAVGLESERRVREAGAVPATIGVLDGVLRIGLDRGGARALRPRRPQGRPARRRRGHRPGRRRRDHRRRHARRLPRGRHRLHGHRRPRRRAPRLSLAARRLRRSRRARCGRRR